MTSRFAVCLILAVLVLLPGCEKLSDSRAHRGDITFITMAGKAEIPADWGRLVSVHSSADHVNIFHLWFEDDEGTIRVAFYDVRDNDFQEEGLMIPRSGEGS